jgi:hypothetical protein
MILVIVPGMENSYVGKISLQLEDIKLLNSMKW